MKTSLPCPKAAFTAVLFTFFFLFTKDIFAQISQLSEDFKKGVSASSLSVNAGYQSATLNWESASFPSGVAKAGYLLIYSTSTPLLLSSPNGHKPHNAILNGTIVSTNESDLPSVPATSAIATGLSNGTTYNFMIVAYYWDGVNQSSYVYSSSSVICITIPPDAPDGLTVNSPSSSSYIAGSFNEPLIQPNGYVVTYGHNAMASPLTDGVMYENGQSISGDDSVLQVSNSTSFNTSAGNSLSASSAYYIHVYSYVISACNNQPVYSRDYLSSDSVLTAPAQKQDTIGPENFVEVIDVEPNPVESNAWLKIATLQSDNNVDVAIYTVDGKIMAQKKIQVFAGVNRISLHTQSYSRGGYVLRLIFSNGKTKAIRFIKK
ncbi:MAG TPA: T9SS type A sorting domain-containing protein [Puia sp.]|nr:T9SS type A sorting domain-containing protein [Puia sp.]